MNICLGNINGGSLSNWYHQSVTNLYHYEKVHPDAIHITDNIIVRTGPVLSAGRGRLCGLFLDETQADALVMIDSDMSFSPATVVEMVDAFTRIRTQHDRVGMLGGLAFVEQGAREIQPSPTIWADHPVIPGIFIPVAEYPQDTLLEVGATGAACVIIARDTLRELFDRGNPFHHISMVNWPILARHLATLTDPAEIEPLLRGVHYDADQLAEDLSFCRRLRDLNWRIFLHTGLRFDHAKQCLIGEPEYIKSRPFETVLSPGGNNAQSA